MNTLQFMSGTDLVEISEIDDTFIVRHGDLTFHGLFEDVKRSLRFHSLWAGKLQLALETLIELKSSKTDFEIILFQDFPKKQHFVYNHKLYFKTGEHTAYLLGVFNYGKLSRVENKTIPFKPDTPIEVKEVRLA